MGFLIGLNFGYGIGWEVLMPVGLVPEGGSLDSMNDSNDGIIKVELEIILNKIWRSGLE